MVRRCLVSLGVPGSRSPQWDLPGRPVGWPWAMSPPPAGGLCLAAAASEVTVPAAGPEPRSVLRRVPAQREPAGQRCHGPALPGELPHPPPHVCPPAQDGRVLTQSRAHPPLPTLSPVPWPAGRRLAQPHPCMDPKASPPPGCCERASERVNERAPSAPAASAPAGRLCGRGKRSGPRGLGSVHLPKPQAQQF